MKHLLLIFLILCSALNAAEEALVISLDDLKANQTKYSGKRVVTSGRLFFTDKRITTRTRIYLKSPAKFGKTYLLQLKADQLKNPQLVNGKTVSIEGLVYGSSSALRACVFTDLEKLKASGAEVTTPEMAFMNFVEELDNIHACREKYKEKVLNLTGYYPLNNSHSSYYSYNTYKGDDYTYFYHNDSSFYIYYPKDSLKDFASLEVGDKINIKAKLSDSDRKLNVSTLKILESFEDRKALKVDLGRVVDSYKKDIIKADAKYKNQKFYFREEIYRIEMEDNGEAKITFRRNYEYIYCTFSKEQTRKLGRYSRGDNIRMEAFHRGGNLDYLYNCRVK
jgi:hypothetical protein